MEIGRLLFGWLAGKTEAAAFTKEEKQ